MREWGSMLTVTGVIATVISVLFALAAFYVQWRRQQGQDQEDTIEDQMERDRIETEESTAQPFNLIESAAKTQQPAPSIQHPASSNQHPATSIQHPAPSESPFRRYTPHGSEETVTPSFSEDEYVWE
ncbi:MAG: hypothetical protein ACOCVH_00700 [Verrucomicrobiota bacterium]